MTAATHKKLTELFPNTKFFRFLKHDGSEKRDMADCLYDNIDRSLAYPVLLYAVFDSAPYRQYFCYDAPLLADAMNEVRENVINLEIHEVIPAHAVQKPRIDIDMSGIGKRIGGPIADKIGQKFVAFFAEYYGIEDISSISHDIYDSSNDEKTSRHIVITSHLWANSLEARAFAAKFAPSLDKKEAEYVDSGIYSDNHSLRCLFADKHDKNGSRGRVKEFLRANRYDGVNSGYCDSIICYRGDGAKLLPELAEPEEVKTFKNGEFTAEEVALVTEFATKHNMEVSGTSATGGIILASNGAVACPACCREHLGETAKGDRNLGVVNKNAGEIYYICWRYKEGVSKCRTCTIKKYDEVGMWTRPEYSAHQYSDFCKCSLSEAYDLARKTIAFVNKGNRVFVRNIIDDELSFEEKTLTELYKNPRVWYKESSQTEESEESEESEGSGKKKKKKTKTIKTKIRIEGICQEVLDDISYTDSRMDPGISGPIVQKYSKLFNEFSGYKHEFTGKYDQAKIQPILDHILRVWANGDEFHYKFIISWFAFILQKPNEKMSMSIILISEKQGAGKNIVAEFVGKHVFGRKYYRYIDTVDALVARFNANLENIMFTLVDETQSTENTPKEISKMLKAKISQTEASYEQKREKIRDNVSCRNNFMFLSNEEVPFSLEKYDNRIYATDISDDRVGDSEYFSNLKKCINDEVGAHFFNFLMLLDISGLERRKPPVTAAKIRMIKAGLSTFERFVLKFAENSSMDKILMERSTIHAEYRKWCENNGIRQCSAEDKLEKARKTYFGEPSARKMVEGVRGYWYETTMQQLREIVQKEMKVTFLEPKDMINGVPECSNPIIEAIEQGLL